jgi:hypothetical protein
MANKTISINEERKISMDKIKLCPSETYDNIILRLLSKVEE